MRNCIGLKKLVICSWTMLICLFISVLLVSSAQAAELKLPSGMKRIESEAFSGNTSLESVVIQEGAEVIESKAFAESSVSSVTLPSSLYSIADDAFSGCAHLTVHADEGTYAYTWAVRNGYIKAEGGEIGEATNVIVPSTLRAGADLTLQVIGPADTIHHSIYAVNEQTGKYLHTELRKASATVTFSGYELDAGATYRLTVYTVTEQYQSLTPVVKTFQVTGNKEAAPSFSIQDKIIFGQSVSVDTGEYSDVFTKYEYYTSNGELFHEWMFDGILVDSWQFMEKDTEGTIKLSYTVKDGELWSDWSDQYTISVTKPDYLAADISFPDTIENGADYELQVTYKNSPEWYYYEINSEETGTGDYHGDYRIDDSEGTLDLVISTRDLDQGRYTFKLYMYSNQENIQAVVYQKIFEVTGVKAAAPDVTCDNNEIIEGNYISFTISTPDIEMVAIKDILPEGYTDSYSIGSQGETTTWRNRCYSVGLHQYVFSVLKDNKWSEWSSSISVLVKNRPQLSTTTIYTPATCSAGQDITFSFDKIENATSYWVSIESPYTGESIYYLDELTAVPDTELTVPGYLLSSGQYVIRVSAYADGYSDSSTNANIIIRGTKPAAPTVNVVEPLRIKNTTTFSINTEGAEILQVKYRVTMGEEGYDGGSASIPVTGSITNWNYLPSEDYQGAELTVSFSIKIQGTWSDWKTGTYAIEGLPSLDPPVIHGANSIEAGADFIFTIDPVEKATAYSYSLSKPDGSTTHYSKRSNLDIIQFNGYAVEPGSYTLTVYAHSDSFATGESIKSFYVIGTKPDSPVVSVDQDEVLVQHNYTFTIDTTNADALVYKVQSEVYPEPSQTIQIQGETTNWRTSRSYPGTAQYLFSVLKNGKWSAWSNPITLSILAKPSLAEPVIEAEENIISGMDFSFSFQAVENAESYTIAFNSAYGDNTLFSLNGTDAHPDAPLTIPGYLINSGSYILQVTAMADDYTAATRKVYISASGLRPTAPTVTVDEPLRIKRNAIFAIDTENAEALQIKYQYASNNTWWSEKSISVPVDGVETQWTHTIDQHMQGVNLTISFSTKRESIWSIWKTLTYTIEGLPSLAPAVIHADDSIEAGTDFSITVEPVEHATSYYWRLYDPAGNQIKSGDHSLPGTLWLNGYDFEAGSYTLQVSASADDYVTSESKKTFTVSGSKSSAPQVSVDKIEAFTDEKFTFTINTGNSDNLVYKRRSEDGNFGSAYTISIQGDLTEWSTSYYNAQTVQYIFAVQMNGKWSAWSDPISVVVRTKPDLEKTVVHAEENIQSGADFNFSFDAVENATSYEIIFKSYYGGDTLYSWRSGTAMPDTLLTIPGYVINAGSYKLDVYANANGYNSSSVSIHLAASGSRPAGPVAEVEKPLRIKSTAVFFLNTTSCEALQVKYQFKSQNTWWSEESISIPVTGAVTQWSQPIDQNMQGVTLTVSFSAKKDGIWSAWKTSSYVIEGLPPLDPAEIEIVNANLAGQDVIIQVGSVEKATSYEYRLYMPDGSTRSGSSSTAIGRVTYSGSLLDAGDYRFKVWARSSEYTTSESEQTFTLSGTRPAAPSVHVDKTDVKVRQNYTFTIDTTDAEALLYRFDNNGPYNINVLESETQWTASSYSAGTHNYSFAVKKDGIWSSWSDPIAVTVSEYDPLDVPTITVASSLEAGRDLTVTLSAVDTATSYSVYLEKTDGTFSLSRLLTSGSELTASFPGYRLNAGDYRLRAYCSSGTISSENTYMDITLASASRPVAPAVTPPESTTASAGSTVTFTLDCTDADMATVRYFTSGNTNNVTYNTKELQSGLQSTEWGFYFNGPQQKYSFSVRVNGVWSEWSGFTTITAP